MSARQEYFGDGSTFAIQPDFSWDVTLPSGKHVRGQADSAEAAIKAVNAAHDQFVLVQWKLGRPGAKGVFVVPLCWEYSVSEAFPPRVNRLRLSNTRIHLLAVSI
jgi:hypothetical protein